MQLTEAKIPRYLEKAGFRPVVAVHRIGGKNFNSVVSLEGGEVLLVKQERGEGADPTRRLGLRREGWLYRESRKLPALRGIRKVMPRCRHFDPASRILVMRVEQGWEDATTNTTYRRRWPPALAGAIAGWVADLHRDTWLDPDLAGEFAHDARCPVTSFVRVTPEEYHDLPQDGIEFLALAQRYPALDEALDGLQRSHSGLCLVHGDLKRNNVLVVPRDQPGPAMRMRLIDWERADWGDPTWDLGHLAADYLVEWATSIVPTPDGTEADWLRSARVPFAAAQGATRAIWRSYRRGFPEVCEPAFARRVIQMAGVAMIDQIRAMLTYDQTLRASALCVLQVAKNLLVEPDRMIPVLLG